MSAIGELTLIILNAARAGIGLGIGYGIVKFLGGRSNEDVKSSHEGLVIAIAGATLEAITVAIQVWLT